MALTYTQFEKIAAACGLGSVAAQDLKNFYDGTMVGLELSGDVSIGGTLDVAGATALAAATTVASTDATKSGLAVTNNGIGSGIAAVKATATPVAAAGSCSGILAYSNGTHDCTAAGRASTGIYVEASSTRSAGANPLTNTAIECSATGGQANYALITWAGDVQLCQAADKLGFHGTAPIAKQTGVAVTAEAIHAALVALGLIAA